MMGEWMVKRRPRQGKGKRFVVDLPAKWMQNGFVGSKELVEFVLSVIGWHVNVKANTSYFVR